MSDYTELSITDQLDITHQMVRSAEEQRVQLMANIRMNEAIGENAKIDVGRRKIAQNFVQTKRRQLIEIDISLEVLRAQIVDLNAHLEEGRESPDQAAVAESETVILEAEENGAVPTGAENGRKRFAKV